MGWSSERINIVGVAWCADIFVIVLGCVGGQPWDGAREGRSIVGVASAY